MSLVRAIKNQLKVPSSRIWYISSTKYALRPFVRFNSINANEKISRDQKPVSLTAQVFPISKDTITENDIDEWIKAVQQLKGEKVSPETESEVYISQLAEPEPFLKEQFEPTEQQLAEIESLSSKKIPLHSDPVIENFTNIIMRDGKKSKAQTILSRALYIVYLKTRKDPMKILYETLDKLGPLMSTKVMKTGAAKNRTVPYPLNKRQRNRFAITWILEGASKKKSPDYSVRLAEEIISAYEGKSSGYDRKVQMHKSAMAHRAYIKL